jgi:predicted lipoprotein with Yx(FWY)xxD motif
VRALAAILFVWGASGGVWAQEEATLDAPGDIRMEERGYGWLLTDVKDMTLYTFSRDIDPTKSACDEECSVTWPPLKASAPILKKAGAESDWSTLTRGDGSLQWVFRGKPLYTFSRDVAPGDANGDAIGRQWYVARKLIPMPPGFAILKTEHGQLLTDINSMTVYTSDADKADTSTCDALCARTWPPVEAWWSASTTGGDWSVVTREDGTKQWAYKSQPLYRYAGDFNPRDIAGHGIETRQAVILEPLPPVPDWITYQQSDGGEILADPQGKTIYAHNFVPGQFSFVPRAPDGKDRPYDWTPVLAAVDDGPVGYWSIVTHEDGTRQWARRGLLLYTNNRDLEPGDLNGVRSTDRIWLPITRSGQTMAGTGA